VTAAWLTAATLGCCALAGWRRAWIFGLAASVGLVLGVVLGGGW
jgi:hypothetical protein